MWQLFCDNGREPTEFVEQPELNIEQSEEGNYSRTISRVEHQVVRRNNLDGGNEGNNGHG